MSKRTLSMSLMVPLIAILSSCSPPMSISPTGVNVDSYVLTDQPFEKLVRASVERLLVSGTTSDAATFFHHNHLNTLNVASGQVGIIHGRANYTPYGREEDQQGYVDVYGFNGEELDPSTGLQRFMYRYYDKDSTRWASPDPKFTVATTGSMSQLGESTTAYTYVSGNPVKYADPTGLGKRIAVMDLHHKKGVHKVKKGQVNSTKNYKKLLGNKRASKAPYMAEADVLLTHSSNSNKTASVSEYKDGKKVKTHKTPKQLADQMTDAGWDKDTLVLAMCNTAYEDVTYDGVTTSFAGHLAKELSANLDGKAVSVIAPEGTVGVNKSGNFYTKDSTVEGKAQKATKTTGIERWKSATSSGGGKATISPLSQETASSLSAFE